MKRAPLAFPNQFAAHGAWTFTRAIHVASAMLCLVYILSGCVGSTLDDVSKSLATSEKATVANDTTEPELNLTIDSQNFGAVVVLSGVLAKTVTVQNTSEIDAFLGTISGATTHFLKSSDTCGSTLLAGQSCQFVTAFQPQTTGELSTTLRISYGRTAADLNRLAILEVTGTGVSELSFAGIDSIDNITTQSLRLNWTPVADATQYQVFEIDIATGSPTYVASVTAPASYTTITGLTAATPYIYRVNAVDALGTLDSNTNSASATTHAVGTFSAITNFTVSEGATGTSAALSCTNAYGSTPTYSIVSESDAGSNCGISGSSPKTISCAPSYKTGHASWSSTVVAKCTLDGTELTQSFLLTISDTNRSPNLDSIADQSITVPSSIASINAGQSAADTDSDVDSFTYTCTFSGGPSTSGNCSSLPGTSVSFNSTTGALDWTPSSAALTASAATIYTITITASDGQASPLTDSEIFAITVNPSASSTPSIALSATSTDFGDVITYSGSSNKTITVTNSGSSDAYLGTVSGGNSHYTISASTCPTGATPLAASATCAFTVTFAPQAYGSQSMLLSYPYGATQGTNTAYTAQLALTGNGISSLSFAGIDSIDQVTTVGMRLNWLPVAGAVSYQIFQINTATGVATLQSNVAAPASSFSVTGLTPNTSYTYRVRVVDNLGVADTNTVNVAQSTDAIGTFSSISNISVAEGSTQATANLSCSDSESNTPSFAISSQSDTDATCTIAGSGPYTVSCTPAYKSGHSAWTADITVACALNGSSISKTFTVNVSDTNRAPALDAIADQSTSVGTAISSINSAVSGVDTDIDGDTVTYSCTFTGGPLASGNCSGLSGTVSFNASTGVFSWTPDVSSLTSAAATTYHFTITGSDNQGTPLTDTETFDIDVNPVSGPTLTITNSSPTNTQTFNLTFGATALSLTSYCILENDTDSSHCSWQAYPLPTTFAVGATNEGKVISVWYKNASLTTGRSDSNSVTLDTVAPSWTGPATHDPTTSSTTTSPTISYTANATDATSGVQKYQYAIGTGNSGAALNDMKDWADTPSTSFSTAVSGMTNGSTYYVNMRAVDYAGNTSTVRSSTGWTITTGSISIAVTYPTENQEVATDDFTVTGTCTAGIAVSFSYSGYTSGPASTTCAAGTFTASLSTSGSSGTRTFTATQTSGGDTGSVTRTFTRPSELPDAISVGTYNACLKTNRGKVRCWGVGTYSTLGNGTDVVGDSTATPVDLLTNDTDVAEITTGEQLACLRKNSGVAKCWGAATYAGKASGAKQTYPATPVGLESGVTKVVTGYLNGCAIVSGALKCWGYNAWGQIGSGDVAIVWSPYTVISSGVTQVVMNHYSTCALLSDTTVKCWGYNLNGQVGNTNNTTPQTTPTLVQVSSGGNLSGVISLHTSGGQQGNGAQHFCAIMSDHTAKCWGDNAHGQLGDNSITDRYSAVTVMDESTTTALTNVQDIVMGDLSTCARVTSGSANGVKCWGYNGSGSAGDGTTTSPRKRAVDSIGLTAGVKALYSNGYRTFCALKTDNSLRCWGANDTWGYTGNGGVADVTTPTSPMTLGTNVSSFSMNQYYSCAVTTTGGVYCWGKNDGYRAGSTIVRGSDMFHATQPDGASFASGVVKAVPSTYSTCAIVSGGTVKCWGDANGFGQLGNGTTTASTTPVSVLNITGATDIDTMLGYSWCALASGELKCWGINTHKNLGDDTITSRSTPVTPSGLSSGVTRFFMSKNTSSYRVCAIVQNGASHDLYCWGHQNYGQVGDGTGSTTGTASQVGTPTKVLSDVKNGDDAVTLGLFHTCAVTSTGGAKCWGYNSDGQLGDGSNSSRNTPVDVSGLTSGVAKVYSPAGNTYPRTCAVLTNGTVNCWGKNAANFGTLGNGGTTSSNIPVVATGVADTYKLAMGSHSTCALSNTGTVMCWGYNGQGAVGVGDTTYRPTPASVSFSGTVSDVVSGPDDDARTFCAVLATSGKVQCWGWENSYDLTGTNTDANVLTPTDVVNLTSGVSSFRIGRTVTCAILTTGQMKCRGSNINGMLGVSPQIRGPEAIAGYE